MKCISFFLISAVALTSCTLATKREPATAFQNMNVAQKIQSIDFELTKIYNKKWEVSQQIKKNTKSSENLVIDGEGEAQAAVVEQQIASLNQARKELALNLSAELATQAWKGFGPWKEFENNPRNSSKTEKLVIDDLDVYAIGDTTTPAFALEHHVFDRYRLQLINSTTVTTNFEQQAAAPFRARLECDGSIQSDKSILGIKLSQQSKVYEFDWYNSAVNGQTISVGFGDDVSTCQLLFKNREEPAWTHKINLVAFEKLMPKIAQFNQHLEVCARPTGFQKQDPVSFFWEQDFNQVTCPRNFDKIVNLRDPLKAFNAKIRDLTGSDVPGTALKDKDPSVKLDFSKAPQLDLIWISSLNFSADFFGDVLAQALRYHADHGTQIRILIPEVAILRKDKLVVNAFMRGRPNVKIQYYKYQFKDGSDGGVTDRLHRVNHTKMLIGYSEKNPQDSFLVTGGRNIRDTYLFHDKPSYSKFPKLIDYARGERPFIYYDDFEVELHGSEVVRPALAQVMEFWNRDSNTNTIRSTNVNVARPVSAEGSKYFYDLAKTHPMVRNVLSVPYADSGMLEKFYVQMIGSAEKEILVTTPYFRPTKLISEALTKASQRGVDIRVLTGINLTGDDVPQLAIDANLDGMNRHLKDLKIYEWNDPKSVMHAKLMVIDQKLSFVSSINLNTRSFIHDTEAGTLVLHEGVAKNLRDEILNYFAQSTQMTEEKKIKWLNQKLLNVLEDYF